MRLYYLLFIIGFISFCHTAPAVGQKYELLPDVKGTARENFYSRLRELLEYQAKGNWGKLFDLSIASIDADPAKKGIFIDELQSTEGDGSRFVSFVPTASVLVNEIRGSKIWLIEGCGSFKRKGRIVSIKSGLDATLHNGTWYFNYVTVIPDAVGGSERLCKPQR